MSTMGEAIALSSPSGRMSGRAREAARRRLAVALFGPDGLSGPVSPQVDGRARLLSQAAELRALAARGMHPRKYTREALRLEAQAASLEGAKP